MGYEQRGQQPVIRQFGGLNVRVSELGLPGNDSPSMMNVDLHPEGSVRSRYGCESMETPEGETKIDAIMLLDQPEGDRAWIYCIAGDTLYRTAQPSNAWSWVESTCAASLTGTLTGQKQWSRETSRYYDGTTEHPNVVYLARADGAPLILLGQTSATNDTIVMPAGSYGTDADGTGTKGYPSDWSGDWPTKCRMVGVGRGARMLFWGFPSDKSRIDYSESEVPWNFLRSNVDYPSADPQSEIDGGYFTARPGAGGEVVDVIDMFGYWVVFKKKRTLIYTSDPGYSDFQVVADFNVGCMSQRSVIKAGNEVYFWSQEGPRALSAVQEYGDLQQGNMSWKVNTLVNSITAGESERIFAIHDDENERIIWFAPLVASDYNDRCFVYYYRTQKWCVYDGGFTNMMDAIAVEANDDEQEMFYGASYEDGVIHLFRGFDDVGDDIDGYYITNWINIGEISDAARAMMLDVFIGTLGGVPDIQYQLDLNEDWEDITRVIKSYGAVGMAWGYFAWGDTYWGQAGKGFRRYEFDALFNLVRFKFYKEGSSSWELMGYRFEARGRGLRA